jgi:hypothetical protein
MFRPLSDNCNFCITLHYIVSPIIVSNLVMAKSEMAEHIVDTLDIPMSIVAL